MPLKSGKSKKTISRNIGELTRSKPSASRAKAIATLASRLDISPAKAKQKQAIAIAYSKSRQKRK